MVVMVRQVWAEFEDTCHGGLDDYRNDLVVYCKCLGIHCTFLILKASPEICVADSRQIGRVKIDQLKAEEVQAREKDANNTDFVSDM